MLDERLLKNRQQRFWQNVRKGGKACTEPGAKDECLHSFTVLDVPPLVVADGV